MDKCRYILNLPTVDKNGNGLTIKKVMAQLEDKFGRNARVTGYEVKLHTGSSGRWFHEFGDVLSVTVDTNDMIYIDFLSTTSFMLEPLNISSLLANSYRENDNAVRIYLKTGRRGRKMPVWERIPHTAFMSAQGIRWTDRFGMVTETAEEIA